MAIITGTQSFDFLSGTSGGDRIFGLGGADTITASAGNDVINGDEGFDAIDYRALATAITLLPAGVINKGGFGQDTLNQVERIVANPQFANTIDASSATGTPSVEINLGGNFLNISNIPGIGFRGFVVENFVNAIGTNNNDTLTGSARNNSLQGRGGDDFFNATAGNDTLDGGIGFDTVDYTPLNRAITLKPTGIVDKGSAGQDTLRFIDNVIGAAGFANTVDASVGAGSSSIDIQLSNNVLRARDVPGVGQITTFLSNFVNVVGTSNNDNLDGNAANNQLNGGSGADQIFGRGGNDTLIGGAGNDFVVGGDGGDRLIGSNATARGRNEVDTLRGEAGNDRFVVGDRSGSYYKGAGNNDVARILDFVSGDLIELGLGETYRATRFSGGFDLFVTTNGINDLIAQVFTPASVSLPTGNFSLASGGRIGSFVGA
jgi:Ca2+-binding RTX toxin-like protein